MIFKCKRIFQEQVSKLYFSYQHINQLARIALLTLLFVTTLHAQKENHQFLNFKTRLNSPSLLLQDLHTQGYAYACIMLDTVLEQQNTKIFQWNVDLGQRILCDSILFDSNIIHKKTLYRIAQTTPGSYYNEQELKAIPKRINYLNGIRLSQQPTVVFFEKSYQLRIPLERVKKNKFDGIMQVQNDPAQSKSVITGNLDLELHNLLKRCETFHFLWKKPTTSSQSLMASIHLPYLFGLPLGINTDLQTFLRDSTFAQSQIKISVYGSVSSEDGLNIYALKTNNVRFQDNPALGNSKSMLYGLQFGKKDGNLSALLPEKGYMFQFGGHVGQRTAIGNTTTSVIYGYVGTAQLHSTKQNFFIQSHMKSEGTFGASFFNNEAHRIGGMTSIRGYFEESIPAFHYLTLQTNVGRRFGNSFSAYLTTDFGQVFEPTQRQLGSVGLGTTLLQNNSTITLSFAWPFEKGIAFEASNARLGIQFNTFF